MKNILNKMKQLNKKTYLIIGILLVVISLLLINSKTIINRIRENFAKEELIEFEYETYEVSGNIGITVVTLRNKEGIEKVTYLNEETNEPLEIIANGKTVIAFDYRMEDLKQYKVQAELSNGEKKTYTIDYEIPRIKGNYTLIGNTYVNEPDLTGLVKENTRYLCLNDSGSLVPGNWITGDAPTEWYNYETQEWANIYVENKGLETYFVWIPRYVYKIDTENSVTGNERMDIKFINTYNEYIDGTTGDKLTWEELKAQGYQLPEAFAWKYKSSDVDLIIPGYWATKYQLSELTSYKLNYNLTASETALNVSTFTNNVSAEAASYTYAINGQIVNTSTTLEDYSFVNATPEQTNTINVTALDAEGRIVASMTKKVELVEVNEPDLSGLDTDTTFYVYWDENGNEHNEIPISMAAPEDWYNYTYSRWANIVTRNNGLETYFVWIPRYQYSLDQTSQRSDIKFIQGTGTETDVGYQIPESFTWTNEAGETVQIPGYWATKYQLSTDTSNPAVTAEFSSSSTAIKVKDITGTIIDDAQTNSTNITYEYYLNGTKMYTGTSNTENYVYRNLTEGQTYTANIILRNADTDKYLGAITKKLTLEGENAPVLTGLVEDRTYYVLYDDDGNMTIGDNIKNDGSNMPENWYSYIDARWANIVVTDGTIVDGQITNATTTSYFVWVPRYQYNLNTTLQRANVKFINGIGTDTETGYKIPEAFTWVNEEGETVQIPGYWASKYQLSE